MICGIVGYYMSRVSVQAQHIAVMIRLTGKDISNSDVMAPNGEFKGVQMEVLSEGRYFYNPVNWDWAVYPMIEIPEGKMGVRIRLYGENLPYGHFLATHENQKGIVPDVLRPGRYAINAMVKGRESERPKMDYAEIIEIHDPINIPSGYRGIVTNLSGPLAEDPNVVIVQPGFRGVQNETLDAGTYYINPYSQRVQTVDCRSQRFNIAENYDMGFPSKDGFWIALDGVIEFRITPEKAAEVFVLYNDDKNMKNTDIHIELVKKIIMPNARSFCRLTGSDKVGRDFIGGETRIDFQKNFHTAMKKTCDPEGVEIVHALITKISPPQAIAKPVRDREVARQKSLQYKEQKLQQDAEALLAIEKATVEQKKLLVGADQDVIKVVTKAKQEQQVAVTKSEENMVVAKQDLEAAKDKAAAILAGKKAEAGVIEFQNAAAAAGWEKAVSAFNGDGLAYARYTLFQKIAPAFQEMMVNTADNPLMSLFNEFQKNKPGKPNPMPPKHDATIPIPSSGRPEDKK
jgi:regulator of protease activity HflC (stomatin/prohibitin superfamily)